ncbi:MAG: hypothetical protein ACP5QP_00680, partial [Brevinematia bacterium]
LCKFITKFLIYLSILFISGLGLQAFVYGQSKKETTNQTSSKAVVQTNNVQTNNFEKTDTQQNTSQVESKKQELPIDVEIKSNADDKTSEGVEYIKVYSKEKGLKIYLEAGGGPLISGGIIYRFNPIFGLGIG